MTRSTTLALLLAATLASANPVLAQDGGASSTPASPPPALAVAPAFGDAALVPPTDLGAITGREDIGALIARADQRNTVSGNSVSGSSMTGAVSLDGNAFQNLQGMAVISANSGNNVAMNSAMNVTINMAPPR